MIVAYRILLPAAISLSGVTSDTFPVLSSAAKVMFVHKFYMGKVMRVFGFVVWIVVFGFGKVGLVLRILGLV